MNYFGYLFTLTIYSDYEQLHNERIEVSDAAGQR